MSERGYLIAVEGLDGSGKATQCSMLSKWIEREVGKCAVFSFPRYSTPTGMKIREYLDGGLGHLDYVERAMLYSDDRRAARDEIVQLLLEGTSVICDRYVLSNMYLAAMCEIDRGYSYGSAIWASIIEREVVAYEMPVCDMTIFLDVDLEVSKALVRGRGTPDRHEADTRLLERVYAWYRDIPTDRYTQAMVGAYRRVDCMGGELSGQIAAREEIHSRVVECMQAML